MQEALNYEALERNVIALVQEFQVKLGDSRDAIALYYPLDSLNRLLGGALDAYEMLKALSRFGEATRATLGGVTATGKSGLFCLRVPAAGVEYVHASQPDPAFLRDFIAAISRHGVELEEIISVFRRYSSQVCVERIDSEEFDTLIYFQDGSPDDFRYCVKIEGPHAVYHRFTPEDYAALGFPPGMPLE